MCVTSSNEEWDKTNFKISIEKQVKRTLTECYKQKKMNINPYTKRGINKVYYFTDTATTTTDGRDVYFPLNLVCERAREGRGRQRRGAVSLPPFLSTVAGISIRKPTGELLWRCFRRGRQELGGAG